MLVYQKMLKKNAIRVQKNPTNFARQTKFSMVKRR